MAEWWNQTPVYEFEEPMYGYTNSRSSRDRHSTSHYNANLTTSSANNLSHGSSRRPERSPRPRSERPKTRRRNSYPPAPHVEDEHISLARELGGKILAHLDEETHNPPAKGEIDQHPILYESSLSASEAASTDTLDTILATTTHHKPEGRGKAQKEWEARQRAKAEEERSTERRFVLLPKSDTYSPNSEDNELDYYSDLRKQKTPQIIHDRGTPSRERTPDPDMGRRRSHHDLPSLKTDIENAANPQAPPSLGRSPNAYSYKPGIKEDLRPSRNGLLSPDVGSARPRSRCGGERDSYFDVPRERERDRDRDMERDERRRSKPSTPNGGTSRPTTPSLSRVSSDFGPRSSSGRQLNPESVYGSGRRDRDGSSRPSSPNTERPVMPTRNEHRRQKSRDTRYDDFNKPRKAATIALSGTRAERDPYKSRRVETFPPTIHQEPKCSHPNSRPTSPYLDSGYSKPNFDREIVKTKRNSREHSPGRSITATMPSMPTMPSMLPDAWPPTFNLPVIRPPVHGHLDPPTMGSYRRQSVDIEAGHIAPLPPCPRTSPTHNAYDWLTLPRCEGFHICPTCYTSNIESTPFRSFFVPRPFMAAAPGGLVCDFGTQPWYRIAWLMLQKNRERDVTLIYRLAEILRTTEECLGSNEAVRDWHSVMDPSTGRLVQDFDVCRLCVEVIEAVLPQLVGAFKRRSEFGPSLSDYDSDRGYGSGGYANGRDMENGRRKGRKRVCDMRFDTENFIHYFDALELVAEQTPRHLGRYLPDMSLFVEVVKKLAESRHPEPPKPEQHGAKHSSSGGNTPPKCQGSTEVIEANWWCIAQLPELTCCSACFRDVVKPEVENRRAIPRMFEVERRERGSCQLYSPRMRKIFRECCASDEFVALAKAARERRRMEREWREDMAWAASSGFSSGKREEEEDKAMKRWARYE